MSGECFETMDVTRLRSALSRIHEQVSGRNHRIGITRRGCDDVCVIISRCELESLERALEILAESAQYKQMCEELTQLVALCGPGVSAGCEA